jgi:hypothetical protein
MTLTIYARTPLQVAMADGILYYLMPYTVAVTTH